MMARFSRAFKALMRLPPSGIRLVSADDRHLALAHTAGPTFSHIEKRPRSRFALNESTEDHPPLRRSASNRPVSAAEWSTKRMAAAMAGWCAAMARCMAWATAR